MALNKTSSRFPGVAAYMTIIADTHVHIYASYDLRALFDAAIRNLSRLIPPSPREEPHFLLCLTERYDCHFFRSLRSGALPPPVSYLMEEPPADPEALRFVRNDGRTLYLIAGRQIVSAENLEVLALCSDVEIPDGKPVREVIARVLEAGGVPILPWSPGKWFFERGEIVRNLIEERPGLRFFIGDTSLRPAIWPTPELFRLAEKCHRKLIYGSDPLPLGGEEARAGSFATQTSALFNPDLPAHSLRQALLDEHVDFFPTGNSGSIFSMLWRLLRLRLAKNAKVLGAD